MKSSLDIRMTYRQTSFKQLYRYVRFTAMLVIDSPINDKFHFCS